MASSTCSADNSCLPLLLLPVCWLVLALAMPARDEWRVRILRATVCWGALVWFFTESLTLLHALRASTLAGCWAAVTAIVIARMWKRRNSQRPALLVISRDPVVLVQIAGIAAILIATAIAAAYSPPNSADAMAYHLPRVVYWAEQGGVNFFPTPYLNQIMLQPFAEYVMLQQYLLSGGDHFINFGQWFAALFSAIGVSAAAGMLGAGMLGAGMLGAGARGQAFAALFCATLPSGILASSGAKNDYVLAMWLMVFLCFALEWKRTRKREDALCWGCALGFALLTKATAYLFAPWLIAFLLLPRLRRQHLAGLAAALGCAALVNAPHYARNYQLSGSVIGFDSAQGNGYFRWRNETFGWKQTASNALRNICDQMGTRNEWWNGTVYSAVLTLHNVIGIGAGDAATTWRDSVFTPPRNSNHEADANNRWHLLLLAVVGLILAWRAMRGRDRERAVYAAALAMGFLSFCFYLKWQPFFARLLLPLFVLAAPLAAAAVEIRARRIQTLLASVMVLFFLSNARSAATENWVRPLRGPRSVFVVPRDRQYFADMVQWNNQAAYFDTVRALAATGCLALGIDINNLQLEYPLQALLRERNAAMQFTHTGVDNASKRYADPDARHPCAIVCLDCAGDSARLARYAQFPLRTEIGKFVVLSRDDKGR